MVRSPCFDRNGKKKGAWNQEEDEKLRAFIQKYGDKNWRLTPIFAGLARCGKSCRLRWVNYLKPGVRRGNFTKLEEELIIELHAELGNKWSAIAEKFPGRTDNDIKNHWHGHLKKREINNKQKKVPQNHHKTLPNENEQKPCGGGTDSFNKENNFTQDHEKYSTNDIGTSNEFKNLDGANSFFTDLDFVANSNQGAGSFWTDLLEDYRFKEEGFNGVFASQETRLMKNDNPSLAKDYVKDWINNNDASHNVVMVSQSSNSSNVEIFGEGIFNDQNQCYYPLFSPFVSYFGYDELLNMY